MGDCPEMVGTGRPKLVGETESKEGRGTGRDQEGEERDLVWSDRRVAKEVDQGGRFGTADPFGEPIDVHLLLVGAVDRRDIAQGHEVHTTPSE